MTGTRLAAVSLLLLGACRGADSPPAATPTTTTPAVASSASPLVSVAESTDSTAPARVAAGARPGATANTTTDSHRPSTTTASAGVTTTSTTALRAAGPKCPDARTCDVYKLNLDKGWRPGPDGVARIPVSINPTPPLGTSLTADQIEADMLAMMAMWEEASPTVRFTYLGRTTREPTGGDGHSDLGYGTSVLERRDGHRYLVEADLVRTVRADETRQSVACDWHRDGGCGPTGTDIKETRQLLAHELGHVLGAADLLDEATVELTMHSPPHAPGDRRRVTLGLGDVLGVRHLYPCGCPLPRIYVP